MQKALEFLRRENWAPMNELQCLIQINTVNEGFETFNRLLTTTTLNDLFNERKQVNERDQQIEELMMEGENDVERKKALWKEQILTQEMGITAEARDPVCGHADLTEKVRNLKQQLAGRSGEQMESDMTQEQEDE